MIEKERTRITQALPPSWFDKTHNSQDAQAAYFWVPWRTFKRICWACSFYRLDSESIHRPLFFVESQWLRVQKSDHFLLT